LRYNRFYIIGESNNKVHTINSVLLFVSYSLISFSFYLFSWSGRGAPGKVGNLCYTALAD